MRKLVGILKWVAGIGFLALLICGGGAAFLVPMVQKQIAAQRERAQGTLVLVEPVAAGELVRTVSAPGTLAAKTTANISSRVSAKIDVIHVDVGDEVTKDQVLVELEKEDLIAALNGAKARLAAEEAQLKSIEANLASDDARIVGSRASYEYAVQEFERQQELFSSGDVSKQSLDNAQTEVDRTKSVYEAALKGLDAARANIDAARAQVESSRAEVDRAQRNVEYCTIRAPFSGVITLRKANAGEMALGTIQNMGTTLMVLDDMSEMIVEARLAETDAPRVAAGQPARVYINGFPDKTFQGQVRRVGLSTQRWTSDNTFYVECEIVVDMEGLRVASATTSNVEIEIETIRDLMIVPSQAVLDRRVDSLPKALREDSPLVDRDKTFARVAFLLKDGKAVMTPVRATASNLSKTAIAEGLEAGAPLIVGPFSALQNLADGAAVRTEEPKKDKEDKATEVAKEGDAEAEPKKDEKKPVSTTSAAS